MATQDKPTVPLETKAPAAEPEGADGDLTVESSQDGDRVLLFPNPDKRNNGARTGAAKWLPTWPFRWLFIGPPGSGKRMQLLNVVMRASPPPDHISVLHLDPESTEYEVLRSVCPEVDYYTPDDPPRFSAFSADERNLLVVDETPSKAMNKAALSDLQRTMNYGSTHRNTAVCFCFQGLTDIDPSVRRSFNLFTLFPASDDTAIALAAHRVGVPLDEMRELFTLCRSPHDSITVDATASPDSCWRYRLNLMTPIYRAR